MEFKPAFALLLKFTIGLPPTSKSEDDIVAVADYLGVNLPEAGADSHIAMLTEELTNQNRFLSIHLETDTIYKSDEYGRSMFVREIVANNRINRQKRINRKSGEDGALRSSS